MQAMQASTPRAPQRSPFAIQELLGLSEGRERERERYLGADGVRDDRYGQFGLPAAVASRVAYAAAFNAQAAVAAAFLPAPPLMHHPAGRSAPPPPAAGHRPVLAVFLLFWPRLFSA
ncbi:hypothetical protein EVAR_98341_1 [Eumeta japonica]|uniref:Uncharacterized protein n=1 Tax=Eumeta variegata TaxID=151549 RepID=A0A4C1XB67_EUMVA|nr:hypothetical protein EVAR_98341_1 [Eumeta japonica]